MKNLYARCVLYIKALLAATACVASAGHAEAATCSPVGTWGSDTAFGYRQMRVGKSLRGKVTSHSGIFTHSASVTITGANTFHVTTQDGTASIAAIISGAALGTASGSEMDLTFAPDCQSATGPWSDLHISTSQYPMGTITLRRRDREKQLGECGDTTASSSQLGMFCGDPINVTTGNVVESIVDIPDVSKSGLRFSRHYNSASGVLSAGGLGAGWSHDFTARIEMMTADIAVVYRGNQRGITFYLDGAQWVADGDITSRLVRLADAAGNTAGWIYTTAGGQIESFDGFGRLVKRTSLNGMSLTLSYDARNRLGSVTDSLGRALGFTYGATDELVSVLDPSGQSYSYTYDAMRNLTGVTFPGGASKVYKYENSAFPNLLTGEVDELGVTLQSWSYNAGGVGISSEGPGAVNKTTINRGVPTEDQITVSDALGRTTVYSYFDVAGISRTASADLTGSGFPSKSTWGYDPNGNIVAHSDFLGNLTCYAHDALRNLELYRVEGLRLPLDACRDMSLYLMPAGARVFAAEWHPNLRLKVLSSEPKRLSSYVYNGQPDPHNGGALATCAPSQALLPDGSPIAVLCKRVEQATTDGTGLDGTLAPVDGTIPPRVWRYTYNSVGKVLTATDPSGATTTYSYYQATTADHAAGDLESVTNAAGHMVRYTKYDRSGRLLETVSASGVTTNIGYHVRGWPATVSVTPNGGGVTQTTTYTYDAAGQLVSSTLPDGTSLQFGYDGAHRLTSVTDTAGNKVTYTLDLVGNRIAESRIDASGALTRNITRIFNGLNRLTSVTGAPQ